MEFQGIPRNPLEFQEFLRIPWNSDWNYLMASITRKSFIFGILFQSHSNPIPRIPSFRLESSEFQGILGISFLGIHWNPWDSKDSNYSNRNNWTFRGIPIIPEKVQLFQLE